MTTEHEDMRRRLARLRDEWESYDSLARWWRWKWKREVKEMLETIAGLEQRMEDAV